MDRLPIQEISSLPPSTVFLDVDGTLVPDGTEELGENSRSFLDLLKKKHNVILTSNSIKKDRTEALGKIFNIPVFKNEKPSIEACNEAHGYPVPYIVVGDKWWTDGIFAKKIGAKYFQVKPLKAKTDGITMKIQYWFNYLTSSFIPIASLFLGKDNKIN